MCYRVLYMVENRIYPNFWEDCDDIEGLDIENEDLCLVSLSGAVKLIVTQYLEDYRNPWVLNEREMSTLAQIMSAEPKIPIKAFIKTLLTAAEDPRQTDDKLYYHVSSFMVSQFAKFKQQPQESLILLNNYRGDVQNKFIDSISQTPYMSQEQLFNASKKRVQMVILRVLETILKHWEHENIRRYVGSLIRKSFRKYFWLKDTEYVREWILCLCKAPNVQNQPQIVTDYFNDEVHPWIVAMKITVKQHVQLTNLKLSDYVIDIIPRSRNIQTSEDFWGTRKSRMSAKMIQKMQDLPKFLVRSLSQMESKRKKIMATRRLLIIANCLLDQNNYYSLKEVLGAIRGILQHTTNSGLSWGDMGYTTLKSFIELESLLDLGNNYRIYREHIEQCTTHAIPILNIHLTEIIDKLKVNTEQDVLQLERSGEKSFLYFNMEMNKMAAQELGKMYSYFTRR